MRGKIYYTWRMHHQTHSEITEFQMSYWSELLYLREQIIRKAQLLTMGKPNQQQSDHSMENV